MGVTRKQSASSKKQTINGSISGHIDAAMPVQGDNYKKVVVLLFALNGTATYVFPTPFTFNNGIPQYQHGSQIAVSAIDENSVTFTGIGPTTSGFCIIEGN